MHVEDVMVGGKTLADRVELGVNCPLQRWRGIEVGDRPAAVAHEVMMMPVGEPLGQLEAIGARRAGHPYGDARLHEIGEQPVAGGQRQPTFVGDLFGCERTVLAEERVDDRRSMLGDAATGLGERRSESRVDRGERPS